MFNFKVCIVVVWTFFACCFSARVQYGHVNTSTLHVLLPNHSSSFSVEQGISTNSHLVMNKYTLIIPYIPPPSWSILRTTNYYIVM